MAVSVGRRREDVIPFTKVNFTNLFFRNIYFMLVDGYWGGWKTRRGLGKIMEVNFPSCKA
jgi:hypothetical protein